MHTWYSNADSYSYGHTNTNACDWFGGGVWI
jgi:hypothetical protein